MGELFAERRKFARDFATQRLHHAVSAFVERFNATSGMVFMVQPSQASESYAVAGDSGQPVPHKLVSVALANVPLKEISREVALEKQGIVGYVAASQRSYMNGFVSDRTHTTDALLDAHYLPSIPTTRSEVAVPIFAPPLAMLRSWPEGTSDLVERELIGVLNLESRSPVAFSPIQVTEIEAAAAEMGVDLRILQHLGNPNALVGWHPERDGWQITELLNAICVQIARAASTRLTLPAISCTIWYADRIKRQLYVRGTTHFDYEYISEAVLPWESFLGSVVQGTETRRVYRGFVDDLPSFRRRKKADRMEVHRVIASAIQRRGTSVGALAIYSFKHEELGNVSFDEMLSDAIVRRLADIVGRVIGEFNELRELVAAAHLHRTLTNGTVPRLDEFEQIRLVAQECLEATWSSVFVRRGRKLHCVSTTGLVGNPTDQKYSLREDEVPAARNRDESGRPPALRTGIIRFVAGAPGRVIRKCDLPDPEERCQARKDEVVTIVPDNRLLEEGASVRSVHWRLLCAGVTDTESVYGVVRISRPHTAQPFVEADERLLQVLCRMALGVFKGWTIAKGGNQLREEQEDARHKALESLLRNDGLAYSRPLPPTEIGERRLSARDQRRAAADRILAKPVRLVWNQRMLESFLHDYAALFGNGDMPAPVGTRGPAFAYLRQVMVDEDLEQWLIPVMYYGTSTCPSLEDDPSYSKCRRNIGWKTVDRSMSLELRPSEPVCIHFQRHKTRLYNCGITLNQSIASGFCLPMCWVSYGTVVEGVLSLDFRNSITDVRVAVGAGFAASLGLGLLGSTLRTRSLENPASESDASDFRGFLESKFLWFTVRLREDYAVGDNRTLMFFGSYKSQQQRWQPSTLQQEAEMKRNAWNLRARWLVGAIKSGLRWEDRRVYLPLRIGGFPVCELVGELKSEVHEGVLKEVNKLRGSWKTIPGEPRPDEGAPCLFRPLWLLASDIMERWACWLLCRDEFFRNCAFEMRRIRSGANDLDEQGLTLWRPCFSLRSSS